MYTKRASYQLKLINARDIRYEIMQYTGYVKSEKETLTENSLSFCDKYYPVLKYIYIMYI